MGSTNRTPPPRLRSGPPGAGYTPQPGPGPSRGCRGASAVEFVGITAAVALLATSVAVSLASHGPRIAAVIDARMARATARTAGSAGGGERQRLGGASGHDQQAATGRYKVHSEGGRERVTHAGEASVTGDDLSLDPVVSPRAVREWATGWLDDRGRLHQHAHVSACALCLGVGGRVHANLGATGAGERGERGGGGSQGLGVEGRGHAHASLAAAEVAYAADYTRGPLTTRGQVRGIAGVGANLEGHGTLVAARHRQELRLAGTAVAGATARAEQRASLRFAGVALQATTGVEGWAGAGATGHLHLVHRGKGRYALRLRGGGAWGLGGAFDVAGSVDASRLLANPDRALVDVMRLLDPKERHR